MPDHRPTLELEPRAYGPDSSPAEIEALRARVTRRGARCVLYREHSVMTPYSVDLCYGRVDELIDAHGCSVLLLDVREAGRPDAEMRRQLVDHIKQLKGRITHVGVILSANPLVSVAIRFMRALVSIPVSNYSSVEAALEAMDDGD